MMLLTSTLLLAAGGALILTTSMSTGTAIDSTAEMQSYYIAEAGLQDAVNVLRGHVAPRAGSGLSADTARLTFRTAVVPNVSNGSTSTTGPYTLAAWLPYNNTNNVPVSLQMGATTFTGGYRVTVEDPDNSHIVTFASTASLGTWRTPTGSSASALNDLNVSFQPGGATLTPANLNTLPYTFATNLGQFTIQRPTGSVLSLPDNTEMPFTLTINQTAPWSVAPQLTGKLTVISAALIRLTFPLSRAARADGTIYTANASVDFIYPLPGADTTSQIAATVRAPDPKRLLVRSVSFGPRQSRKQLEMIVKRSNFEFEAPATITLQGSGDCSPITLDTGSSGAKDYSGMDQDSAVVLPAFAVPPCQVGTAESGIKKHDTVTNPEIGVLGNGVPPVGTTTTEPTQPVGTPSFLESADAARDYLNTLQAVAEAQGRYFRPAAGSAKSINGSLTDPVFNFVDGDCILDGGAGLLVVTGNLEMNGNPSFNGIILVLGAGSVNRDGGGNGQVFGAMVVAKFARTWPASENGLPHPFLSPTFHTNGGGTSNMQYSSLAIARAFSALGSSVAGVREF